MTSVVVWVGVDSRGPGSTYIATDSRFSWPSSRRAAMWDQGRKTFASSRFPDVAGYWGDVLFPVVALSQFFAKLDAGAVAELDSVSETRFRALERSLRISFAAVPSSQRRRFTVVHAGRDGHGMGSQVRIRALSWSQAEWSREAVSIPAASSAVQLGGSGAGTTAVHLAEWNKSSQGGTSRAVYSAFVDGLLTGSDRYSGGAPQLVGLYRTGAGRAFGTVVDRCRFLYGAPVTAASVSDEIEWRNELFERVSGSTRKRLPDAQRHDRPAD